MLFVSEPAAVTNVQFLIHRSETVVATAMCTRNSLVAEVSRKCTPSTVQPSPFAEIVSPAVVPVAKFATRLIFWIVTFAASTVMDPAAAVEVKVGIKPPRPSPTIVTPATSQSTVSAAVRFSACPGNR